MTDERVVVRSSETGVRQVDIWGSNEWLMEYFLKRQRLTQEQLKRCGGGRLVLTHLLNHSACDLIFHPTSPHHVHRQSRAQSQVRWRLPHYPR